MTEIINKEAENRNFKRIEFICGEVEKVFRKKEEKHYFWEKYGSRKLDPKYIQPALDENNIIISLIYIIFNKKQEK